MPNIDEIINTTKHVQTARMLSWSSNYDFTQSPAACFMDMIGFSEEHFGTRSFTGTLGYLEADMVGQALIEWSNAPQDVENLIIKLMEEDA